jgi:hypothetical protein
MINFEALIVLPCPECLAKLKQQIAEETAGDPPDAWASQFCTHHSVALMLRVSNDKVLSWQLWKTTLEEFRNLMSGAAASAATMRASQSSRLNKP